MRLFHIFTIVVVTAVMVCGSCNSKENKTRVKEKCYQELGCVRLTQEWSHPKFRPVNVWPSDRHSINTIFVHWTINNGYLTSNILGMTDLKQSSLGGSLKLFIHDFTSNGYTGWIQHLARILLKNPETVGMNIVSVDWAAGAEPPYVQAVANARLVALEVITFLNQLKTTCNMHASRVHVVGHGLGAHIAGYVGKMLHLRRITALDPSGPHFTSMPENVRLDKNDASYVEVIHSDSGPNGHGNPELLGHVDFFPNGGKCQPGCVDSTEKMTALKRGDLQLGEQLSACSHKRSVKYYIEALVNTGCIFVGVACNSYKDFLKGRCTRCGDKMEYCVCLHPLSHTRPVNNTYGFYFITSNSSPFCGEMLKVLLALSSSTDSTSYIKGSFNVTIPQRDGEVNFMLNENQALSALRADDKHMFVVFRTTPPVLELPASEVRIKWLHGRMPFFWRTLPKISNFMVAKISDKIIDTPQWFCPVTGLSNDPKGIDMQPCPTEFDTTTEEDYIEP